MQTWNLLLSASVCNICRGFESVVEDYFPPSTKTLGRVLVYLMSFGTFAGLMYLNIKDVGICKAVKLVWSV